MTISTQRGTGCGGPEVKTQKCMHKYYPDMYLILYFFFALQRANNDQSHNLLQVVFYVISNQIKKFYLKSVHFITIQHKLSRQSFTTILEDDGMKSQ
jgi:hypothetical protein